MQAILQLFFANLNIVIQILFLTVLGLISVYFFKNIREEADSSSSINSLQVEGLLRKVLEVGPMASTAGGGSSGGEFDLEPPPKAKVDSASRPAINSQTEKKSIDEAAADEQISLQLSKDLQEKENRVKQLEAEVEALKVQGNAGGGFDTKALETRIKDLEEKLAEYEVIEDDIANLSLYKEENARLKDEVRAMKSGGGQESTPEPAADVRPPSKAEDVAGAATSQVSNSPAVFKEESKSQGETSDSVSAIASKVAGPIEPAPTSDSVVEEFARAVEEQKAAESSAPNPAEASTPTNHAPSATDAADGASNKIAQPSAEPPSPISQEPAATIASSEPAEPAQEVAALAGDVDPDKMLSEVNEFSQQTGGKKAEANGPDEAAQLLQEFESFVKKG
ncbi:MAG: hypothetical protein COT74_00395 [Bdellovibrionales bacterium CG10_big_fil_rev_8_21_14_0_10_45_34]|nr:MAG: hypothetical protein COT74_00395 [Bdellovibrionales bacterium CG10_big_fil_rev_8_21_14_0_10_45_34]